MKTLEWERQGKEWDPGSKILDTDVGEATLSASPRGWWRVSYGLAQHRHVLGAGECFWID